MTPDLILDKHFGSISTHPHPYPQPLPEELKRWHLHTVDNGHCIAVAVASTYQPGGDPGDWLVPIPVRAVQRLGYEVRDGYVVCKLQTHPVLGVVGDFDADLEFEGVDPDE